VSARPAGDLPARVVPDYRALAAQLAPERARGKTLALANGCFDVLHVGHVRLLAEARGHADLLVVALNSDASARALKGEGRPFVPLAERMEVVAALAGVDYVTSFAETTAGALIDALRPDVQIKGTDRSPETVPERAQLERWGGRIVICGDAKTHSSTELGAKLRR
jgi:rfaE bifunctional protein nucleotidyltransferase chain/domain